MNLQKLQSKILKHAQNLISTLKSLKTRNLKCGQQNKVNYKADALWAWKSS